MTRTVRVALGVHHPSDDRPGVEIQTPYNEGFVEDLKRTVPHRERSWDSVDRVWWASEEHAEAVIELVIFYFGEAEVVDADGAVEYRNRDGVVSKQEGLF